MVVRQRHLTALLLLAALALGAAACGEEEGGPAGQAGGERTLTVWLMDGSANKPNEQPTGLAFMADLTREFEAAHPGVKVKYEVQQWNGIQERLTTALASNDPPDVIELGNTQTAKFAQSGALLDLTSRVEDLGARNWLHALAESGQWEGKQYGVPFYAGDRVVFYRKDLFEKSGLQVPTSRDEFVQAGLKLMADNKDVKDFNALYLPGQNWYVLLSFIWDEGGDVAVKEGETWKGALHTPQAQAGIQFYADLVNKHKLTTAPKDTDEANPQQFEVFAKGNVAMMIGLNWELGSAISANPDLEGKVGAFALPSKNAGQAAPVFLGGSHLAIPAGSKDQDLAYDWVKLMASEKYQARLAKEHGAIPNATTLAGATAGDPILSEQAKAAQNGRVTPTDPRWAEVEASPNPLKDLLTAVLTGKASPAEAAQQANQVIEERMNKPL